MGMTKNSKGKDNEAVVLTVYVPPVPASRPRVTRWGTYYTKTYKSYREAADAAIPRSINPPLTGNLKVTIDFACHRPPTTKRLSPRGDIDNHIKAILDSVVGHKKNPKGYITDDMQITELYALKRWVLTGEEPHTRIKLESL